MSLQTNVKDKNQTFDLKARKTIPFEAKTISSPHKTGVILLLLQSEMQNFQIVGIFIKATELNPTFSQDLGLCTSDMHASRM